jgi:hypothetical protein
MKALSASLFPRFNATAKKCRVGFMNPRTISQLFIAFGYMILATKVVTSSAAAMLSTEIAQAPASNVFYLSPNGDDNNPGTHDEPWKTFGKAVRTLRAGDTAYFEPGVYDRTTEIKIKNRSGTASAPICFQSEMLHQAVIRFHGVPGSKLIIFSNYITIQGFEITQDQKSTDDPVYQPNDRLVECSVGSRGCAIRYNVIHNTSEDCIKSTDVTDALIEGNVCYDSNHEGIDMVNGYSSTIRDNLIYDVGRIGIMAKGGSRDIQIYDNRIRQENQPMDAGIELGGSSVASVAYDKNGYEAYNLVAYNNVVMAKRPGSISRGLSLKGAAESGFYNNVVVGADYGLATVKGAGLKKGWTWRVNVSKPTFRNNIILNAVKAAAVFKDISENLDHDYNLYFNSPHPPKEPHGLYKDPRFVDDYSDWHLQSDSPALGSGVPIDLKMPTGALVEIAKNAIGVLRDQRWNRGIY